MTDTSSIVTRPEIKTVTTSLSFSNHLDHFLARFAYNRMGHKVAPGLYAVGVPVDDSPVFVTANYTLSFDALRKNLANLNCYILVLDTKGVNVWCAAGEGTFGTDELVRRVEEVCLHDVVSHKKLILPQLGAPGVIAHEVKKRTGFKVSYGPVRAEDIREYMEKGEATAKMRRVRFPFYDRLILTPVELVLVLPYVFIVAAVLYFVAGPVPAFSAVAAVLAGAFLTPILLPAIPFRDFSAKGFFVGGVVAIPFVLMALLAGCCSHLWVKIGWAIAYLLLIPAVSAFLALNFTGSTTFTSMSGVKREMFKYTRVMAYMFGTGLLLMIFLIGYGAFLR